MDETEYLYGVGGAVCCVCGRVDTLLVPYGDEGLACVECVSMENGETIDDDEE
jgi:Zn ribbon nucleic-acid-binding protein